MNGRTETGAAVTAARTVVGATALAGLVRPASEPAPLGAGRSLPVLPELAGLLPHGVLRRGSVVAVATGRPVGNGGTSLLLALLAQASRAGSWCAVVGLPELGMAAAADLGIALDRFALVPAPGPDWTAAVAALIDGLDVVVAAVPATVGAAAGCAAWAVRTSATTFSVCCCWATSCCTICSSCATRASSSRSFAVCANATPGKVRAASTAVASRRGRAFSI